MRFPLHHPSSRPSTLDPFRFSFPSLSPSSPRAFVHGRARTCRASLIAPPEISSRLICRPPPSPRLYSSLAFCREFSSFFFPVKLGQGRRLLRYLTFARRVVRARAPRICVATTVHDHERFYAYVYRLNLQRRRTTRRGDIRVLEPFIFGLTLIGKSRRNIHCRDSFPRSSTILSAGESR